MRIHNCLTVACFLLGGALAWAAESKAPLAPEIIAAAERGEADAQYQVARACLRGVGMPKDVKRAYELMKSAADKGQADAIGGLGYFYSAGIVLPKNDKLAAEWLRKGAEKGSAKARLNLGKLLLTGNGGEDDATPENLRDEGMQWIRKAADQGLPEAALAYGSILYFGEHGVAQDYAKAATFFKLAADQGLPDAQNFLGTMNELGLGMPVNVAAATAWYRKAALQWQLKAQSNLGTILNPLAGDKATRMEALAWLIIADSQGEVTAAKMLQDTVPGLKDGEFDEAQKQAADLRRSIR